MARHCPGHHVLGEEDIAPGSQASIAATEEALKKKGWLWVIDPIDGTTNFVHSLPASVVSIGVAFDGKCVIGVIFDPYRDELFSAKAGGPAFVNGVEIHVSKEDTLASSLVGLGVQMAPSDACKRVPTLRVVSALGEKGVRGIRDLGSAALHLAWVACGRISAWFQLDLHPWDLSAGAVIVKAAGGKVSELTEGGDYTLRTRNILASNGLVHKDLLACIKEAKGDRLEGATTAAAAPKPAADVPVPPEAHRTWDDDPSFGKECPSLSSLLYCQGDAVEVGKGEPVLVWFWAKFAKGNSRLPQSISHLVLGDYLNVCQVSDIHHDLGIKTVGISMDPEKVFCKLNPQSIHLQ